MTVTSIQLHADCSATRCSRSYPVVFFSCLTVLHSQLIRPSYSIDPSCSNVNTAGDWPETNLTELPSAPHATPSGVRAFVSDRFRGIL